MTDGQVTTARSGGQSDGYAEIRARKGEERWTQLQVRLQPNQEISKRTAGSPLPQNGHIDTAGAGEHENSCPAPENIKKDRYYWGIRSLPDMLSRGSSRPVARKMKMPSWSQLEQIFQTLPIGGGGVGMVGNFGKNLAGAAKIAAGTKIAAETAEALPAIKAASYSKPPVGSFSEARYAFEGTSGQYRELATGEFVSPRNLPWPNGLGFMSSTKQTVQPGKILDRFGKESGRYFSEPYASISERGMARGTEELPYRQYRVLKPTEMRLGKAAPVPEFGANGGAKQYVASRSAAQLVEEGYLELIK